MCILSCRDLSPENPVALSPLSNLTMTIPPNPGHIMQVRRGVWASKTLLSAVEIGLFTELAKGLACP